MLLAVMNVLYILSYLILGEKNKVKYVSLILFYRWKLFILNKLRVWINHFHWFLLEKYDNQPLGNPATYVSHTKPKTVCRIKNINRGCWWHIITILKIKLCLASNTLLHKEGKKQNKAKTLICRANFKEMVWEQW